MSWIYVYPQLILLSILYFVKRETCAGRSVTAARDVWDVLVRVQISAPRLK